MQFTVEDLLGQIEQYHLMSPKDVPAVKARWFRPERKDAQDAARFCDWLRVNNYLTEFVLSALTRGKADQLALNQYRLTDWLRTGPEAGDFLATDPLERLLRVQIVAPEATQGPAWFEQFRQAAQRLMKVLHPGVARALDFGQARGIDYLVSEHVEGESLEDVLNKHGKLNYDLAARIFALVFDALAALHEQGVRAGELSAACIVFAGTGKSAGGNRTIRLVNVAFPRRLFDATALGIIARDQLPEPPRHTGPSSDVYQLQAAPRPEEEILRLGSICYRCVTGREAYPTSDSPRPGLNPPPVQKHAPEVPGMLADLIDSMVDTVVANRPRSAAAVAKALRVFLKTEEEEKQSRPADKIAVAVHSPPPLSADREEQEQNERLSVDPVPPASGNLGADSQGLLTAVPGEPEISRYFRAVMRLQGSDLHMAVGNPPMLRLRNVIRQMDLPPLTQEEMERLVAPIITPRSQGQLDQSGAADFAYIVGKGEGRFRVNLFKQRGHFGLVARRVNANIPTFQKLGLPPVLEQLCLYDQGMVILAGVTGSGKSTTLAAMLDYINEREQVHVLTIEDPIEYLFTNKKAVINQREVGIDVADWKTALKHAVRQDPDVILVGEMRDRETFEAGINAAETGHLVFCTIHASSAPSTIGRILDLFPADMHQAMRQSLAFNLKAVVCQKLLPSIKPGVQRVPTNEIMILNPTIRDLIIKGEDKKLPDAVRIGMIEGMIDFNESLRQLVARGDVDQAAALEASPNPEALKMAFKGIRLAQPGIL
ncbi:MAG TPA: PilT/PilU family type 4a pilus ATPase [Gemmataceae bacterium]|jgi:twitching motility protein PilT|nr:PilT/PilU family type 4a pilus ATPase [Gemmataceae bacterium]